MTNESQENGTSDDISGPRSIQDRHLPGVQRYRKNPKRSFFPGIVLVVTLLAVVLLGRKLRESSRHVAPVHKKSSVSYIHGDSLAHCRIVFRGREPGWELWVDGRKTQAMDTLFRPGGWHVISVMHGSDSVYHEHAFYPPGKEVLIDLSNKAKKP